MNWEEEAPRIRELGRQGWGIAKIARDYGLTRQRMKQVIQKYVYDWVKHLPENMSLYQVQRLKFRSKKANALRTGYTWEIEFGDIAWPSHCPILGTELDYFAECVQENSPSFDRLDSTLGYVKGNVIIVSWRANRIKNNGTAEEHFKIATYLTQLHTTTLALSRDCVLN